MSRESCEDIYKAYLLRALNLIHDLTLGWEEEEDEEGEEIPGTGRFIVDPDWLNEAQQLLDDADIARKRLEAKPCDPSYWGRLNQTVVPTLEHAIDEFKTEQPPQYADEDKIGQLGVQAGYHLPYLGRWAPRL